ncbi:hypothetical protein FA95DRAFT_1636409 [Auriscalpium vulgare]|uniref:Uncharacterized protein n=1 Tax=Auriscalpium vulgare TaxID=40419 RepID=A0ACB8RES7_9AGAM|nr:hypothetical protein FA95DRAFT_1636409 [Auriscalpium vulgare]
MASDIPLGSIVEIPLGRGVVRFYGITSFSPGKWVGIELSEAKGKNDGSVQGVPYFSCQMNYGVFVKASQVKVVSLPASPSPHNRTPPQASGARPTLGHARTSSTGVARVPSVRSVQSSVPPSPRAGSPLKASTSVAITRGARLAPPSPTKRASPSNIAPTPIRRPTASGRPSSIHESNLASRNGESQDTVPVARALPFKRVSSPPAPPPLRRPSFGATRESPRMSHTELRSPTPPIQPPSPPPAPPDPTVPLIEEIQGLHAKIRVLEAKRADDARHVRELETKLGEAESFVALRPKLQAKLSQLQTDLIATRRELADTQQLSELAESRNLDAQEQLEMAMLDKEVAEERAELAEAEVEELKEKLAVVEVELGVIKTGGSGASLASEDGGDPNVASSLPYIQLEKQNARLKEALVRLRDITSETEADQRRRIAEMEKDVLSVDDLQVQLDETLIKLANAEIQIEDLKAQLDDTIGVEEMLVPLTERNLLLGEKIEEMRITIEDLEALKELSDELEENHVETEKAMQDEINEKDVLISNQQRKIESLEDICQDLESTIGQFREFVLQLQSELDTLRSQTQTAQTESAAAASQTAAMMSLNMKLQSTASKHQAKHIDFEVKRIEASEAKELLSIIQPFLPQMYLETDSDATSCYLLFQRMAFKADLINNVTAQTHGLPDALNGPVSDTLVGVCELRGAIATLSTICKRFAAILRHCDVESFLSAGRLYPEIVPMEKRIDMHIDLLRREEFREMECASDINRIQAQFDHLAETYFEGFDLDLGERELGFALSLDHDLDVYASSVGLTKTAVEAIMGDEGNIAELGTIDAQAEFFEPIQKSLDQCKSAKVVSRKLAKRLEELTHDSAALKAHLAPRLKTLINYVSELVNFGIQLAQQTMPHIHEVRESKSAFQLGKVISYVRDTATSTVGKTRKDASSAWAALSDAIGQLIFEANSLLPITMENENIVKITGTAPWVVRVGEIKASMAVNVEAERKVAQLNEEMQSLMRTLKQREQGLQESSVKIELMERRMDAVKKQADTIVDLEGELSKARKQERAYEDAMEQLQADLDALEQENGKLKVASSNNEKQAPGNQASETETIAVEGNLETSYLLEQIEGFRGAVRFLRMENSYLKGQDLLKEIQDLAPLPAPTSRAPTPPLVASGLSDTDDSDNEAPAPAPTLRTLTTERKVLLRDVMSFSAGARVVDLSTARSGRAWVPTKKTAAYQVWERRVEAERLQRRVQGLVERTNSVLTRLG